MITYGINNREHVGCKVGLQMRCNRPLCPLDAEVDTEKKISTSSIYQQSLLTFGDVAAQLIPKSRRNEKRIKVL
ncbi:Phenylalanine--tRNA ligase alpha subunit [Manis javanica]|nr:Phenylalanine--tRNA ligase alpha subunit [Manis javanica]